jgi:hypothetical protein
VSDGAFELDEVDGDLWLWDYESPDGGEARTPRRILAGEDFEELDTMDLDRMLVPQGATWLGDLTVWLEGTNAGTRIRTDEGLDVAVDSLLDIDGMNEMYVNGLRAWDDGLVILGSMADEEGQAVLFLLTSPDGESWSTVELEIPDGLSFDPEAVRLLDVDDTGRVVINPGTSDLDSDDSSSMLLVVEPGSATTAANEPDTTTPVTDPNRAAADQFLDAWARGDRDEMLELAEPGAVDNAFAIAPPAGPYERCSQQQNGQFECFVDTTATYQAYVQVGEPGGDTSRVSWVGPVAQ